MCIISMLKCYENVKKPCLNKTTKNTLSNEKMFDKGIVDSVN